jgi:hypothetical protein
MMTVKGRLVPQAWVVVFGVQVGFAGECRAVAACGAGLDGLVRVAGARCLALLEVAAAALLCAECALVAAVDDALVVHRLVAVLAAVARGAWWGRGAVDVRVRADERARVRVCSGRADAGDVVGLAQRRARAAHALAEAAEGGDDALRAVIHLRPAAPGGLRARARGAVAPVRCRATAAELVAAFIDCAPVVADCLEEPATITAVNLSVIVPITRVTRPDLAREGGSAGAAAAGEAGSAANRRIAS